MIYVLSIKLCLFLCVYFMYLFIIEILKNHRNIKIKIIDNSTIQINTVFFSSRLSTMHICWNSYFRLSLFCVKQCFMLRHGLFFITRRKKNKTEKSKKNKGTAILLPPFLLTVDTMAPHLLLPEARPKIFK